LLQKRLEKVPEIIKRDTGVLTMLVGDIKTAMTGEKSITKDKYSTRQHSKNTF